ncbi:hypothetical protein CGMCC3_g4761 [Colletotrichum fructicola]|uniref:Uncharacterized protein n=2 Tax=Colletotrichum gloeosporioides species complex TaxID=2707338 RepID=L2FJF7_COLFN|nr:uncharacterized protein CGMCC3_g4761 [Colletotrichum fructicola]KAF4488798.1 hypothetical protein CGGC5_v002916 [Colletotrichum fructicola Nara gc5]KAF4873229.1 hypothetical protein CGCSCA1_v007491 [Colletotrichum siamense]KAJ3960127.1 hypothetical protein N0V92_003231 [Colletotrichum tropicale]KAK1853173.1 hypothetical protein CCHR01_04205 [Colletotrichum chrysophilum]KAE9579451.1 hypothetical protein CGMCC3_g4761 [Colletotrichum fructicola]
MQLSITSIVVTLAAMASLAAAAPQQNNARENFKNTKCKSQACKDSVDSGCPLSFINFELGGCDDPSF